jgi:hypothetical protein
MGRQTRNPMAKDVIREDAEAPCEEDTEGHTWQQQEAGARRLLPYSPQTPGPPPVAFLTA